MINLKLTSVSELNEVIQLRQAVLQETAYFEAQLFVLKSQEVLKNEKH